MSRPPHHGFSFWLGPVVFVLLGLLIVDSYYTSTSMRIPRGESKVPFFLGADSGLLLLDIEQTPDPYIDKVFSFKRVGTTDRRLEFVTRYYHKFDAYKYPGKTREDRRAAQKAGIRAPLLAYEIRIPIWMLMTLVGMVWGSRVMGRSRRMVRKAMRAGEGLSR